MRGDRRIAFPEALPESALEDKCRCRTGNTAANLALLRGAVLKIWKTTRSDLPAPAFVLRNQRKLDEIISLMEKNQRLTKMQ
jgi:hypothetical protein